MSSNLVPRQSDRGGQQIVKRRSRPTLQRAVSLWAKAKTDPDSSRRSDLLHDKQAAVMGLFDFLEVYRPQLVTPADVDEWIEQMEDEGLASATVYARVSLVSSFYRWAMSDPMLRQQVSQNPAALARPRAPKPYHGSQALTDEEVSRLLDQVRGEADDGKLSALRDYAMLLFFLLTGHRRSEVCRLTWGDLSWSGDVLTVRFLNKGGDYKSEEVDGRCWRALGAYLEASGRFYDMEADTPLWVGHDRAGQAQGALSSHSFAKNLKRYARDAGVEDIHVHKLRHTVARMVGDNSGDIGEVQRVLGHKNQAVTRIYADRLMVKKNRHSEKLAERMGL